MKFSLKTIGLSLCLLLATSSALHAQEKSPQEMQKSCRNVVQRFYNRLVWEDRHPNRKRHGPDLPLSPELSRQLKAYDAADRDGVGALDFDPIWMGQDICTRYVVGKIRRKNNRYLVEVYCIWSSEKKKDYMEHEMMFAHGRWMIMNIHYYWYEKDKPPHHRDLLSILKEDRKEDPKAYQKKGRKRSK